MSLLSLLVSLKVEYVRTLVSALLVPPSGTTRQPLQMRTLCFSQLKNYTHNSYMSIIESRAKQVKAGYFQ